MNAVEPGVEAHVGPDLLVDEAVEDAGGAREGRADEEGRRDHPVDVDPHHLGRLAVEGDGAHRPPELRARDEERQGDHQHHRPDDDDDLGEGETDARREA